MLNQKSLLLTWLDSYSENPRGFSSQRNHSRTRCVQFEENFDFIPIFGIFDKISNQMNKNTSISLGNYFDQFVQNRINEGRFKNVSEVIRAGLRLLEEEESKVIALKRAIQEGIDSGIAHDFDPKKHLESLKAKKHSNG
jgi:antitoxin ParD1/3/4